MLSSKDINGFPPASSMGCLTVTRFVKGGVTTPVNPGGMRTRRMNCYILMLKLTNRMKRDQKNRIWKRGAWLTFLLLFSGLPLMFAQSVVTGTVKDASGENLIGVNVIVKGTSTGVSTNVNGEFSIRVSDANATLEFSYVGYQTEEVRLQGRTVLNVVMREDVGQLEEVWW